MAQLFSSSCKLDILLFMGTSETTSGANYGQVPVSCVLRSDRGAEIIERNLLLTFVIVATLGLLWRIGTGLEWLWSSCASEIHSAVLAALQ